MASAPLSDDAIARWLAARPRGGDWLTAEELARDLAPAAREESRLEDVLLARGAERGVEEAVRAVDGVVEREVTVAARRFRLSDDACDEACQRVREKLLVGAGCRIGLYDGRGTLTGFVRAVAVRHLLDETRKKPVEKPASAELFDALTACEVGLETSMRRKAYESELRAAFADAVEMLSTRERNMLRYAFVDGIGIDAVSSIYGIHRATAARRLDSARDALAEALVRTLAERVGGSETEAQSALRQLLDGVELSLSRYLGRSEAKKSAR